MPCGRNLVFDPERIDAGVQMLVANEKSIVSQSSDVTVSLQNHGGNVYSLHVTDDRLPGTTLPVAYAYAVTPGAIIPHPEQQGTPNDTNRDFDSNKDILFGNVLRYVHKQMMPLHSECVAASRKMQDHFGMIVFDKQSFSINPSISNSFMQDNAVGIGMLLDMLNRNWHAHQKNPLISHEDQPVSVYSLGYAARLLFIGSVFCGTAPPSKKTSLFHVSQARMSEMPEGLPDSFWSEVTPEKNHISLLLKGESAQQRVMRCNLAVRMIAPQDEFATKYLPSVMGMNTSISSTGIMLLAGVCDKTAAVIYVNSETADEHVHKMTMNAFSGHDFL
jgi:hypothetical protein